MVSREPPPPPLMLRNPKLLSPQSNPSIDDEFFWQGVGRSIAAHVILLILLLFSSLIVVRPPLILTQSIRVDLVELPDFTKKELQERSFSKEEPHKAPVIETKKESHEPSVFKIKKGNLKGAIERIRALEKIEQEVKQKPTYKGNIVSKGTQMTGEVSTGINEFGEMMRTKLAEHWDLPVWLSRQQLSAKVLIFLDKLGYVHHTVFIKSSGNTQYDQYVLKTIRTTQPFGPPPSELLGSGITLGFPL